MKRKLLIIVENNSVPFDRRVWMEALALQAGGYDVTVLCPKRRPTEKRYEILEGVRVYRHPLPGEGNSTFAYIAEYICALLLQFVYTTWIYCRHGFQAIHGCNPPDNIF